MNYPYTAIPESAIPQASNPFFQHLLDTYASEANKVVSIWSAFSDADLDYKPHPKSASVSDLLKHQLLGERRFFGAYHVFPEPPPEDVLPETLNIETASARFVELTLKRLDFFTQQDTDWWAEVIPFYDVQRQRIWVFWRRVLHAVHHRTQLTVYLRLLGKPVPSVYGPTADISGR
jgi:uncharacterized damage-inducible protein DinB